MPPRLALPRAHLLRTSRPQIRPQQRYSSEPTKPQPSKHPARISRIIDRLPRFMHPYVAGLRDAPSTHILSFLILHELTAIVPLLVLGGAFHYTGWLPAGLDEGRVLGYMEKFGGYFGRKGWFGVSRPESPESPSSLENGGDADMGLEGSEGEMKHVGGLGVLTEEEEERIVREGAYGRGTRVVLEVATAYAITKALFPVRILGSVWATPWFARRVLGMFKKFRR